MLFRSLYSMTRDRLPAMPRVADSPALLRRAPALSPTTSAPRRFQTRVTLNLGYTGESFKRQMANLTIAVPDEVLKSARKRAFEQGTSVNAVLRDYLGQFAGVTSARQSAAQRILDLSKKARSGRGTGKWTRDDLHER